MKTLTLQNEDEIARAIGYARVNPRRRDDGSGRKKKQRRSIPRLSLPQLAPRAPRAAFA
jgi:hypothetical protein